MRVAFSAAAGILSAQARDLIKESRFLLLEYRQASEWQELAPSLLAPNVTCPEANFRFSVVWLQACS